MIQLIKGVLITVTATGIACSMPENYVVAQAPVIQEWKVELIENPVLKADEKVETSVPAFAVQQTAQIVREELQKEHLRELEEKKKAEALRKQKLKQERKRAEKKRKQQIQACCGVAAGTHDQKILERIVEAEAGGENYKGKLLVANVVLNRVKSKKFPSTVKKVVFAHRQFSPVWDGRYYKVKVSAQTKKAVRAALQGKDPSKGALYFMQRSAADSANVTWFDTALTRLYKYGCHEFYK